MPASTYRLTASGACASCGADGGTQHRPTCQPDVVRRIKLQPSRRARRDVPLSAIMRDRTRFEDEVLRRL